MGFDTKDCSNCSLGLARDCWFLGTISSFLAQILLEYKAKCVFKKFGYDKIDIYNTCDQILPKLCQLQQMCLTTFKIIYIAYVRGKYRYGLNESYKKLLFTSCTK